MRHTQDIVLARLRELAGRWRSGASIGVRVPDPSGSDPSASTASGHPAFLEETGPGPEGSAVTQEPVVVASNQRLATPWARLGGLVAALALVVAGIAAFQAWPRPVGVGPAPAPLLDAADATAPPGDPSSGPVRDAAGDPFRVAAPTSGAAIVVHVAGEVRRPGVVRLPAGSRVVDAVEAAGGIKRGGSVGAANLARVLSDGERVEVGSGVESGLAPQATPPGSAASSTGGAGTLVDLNTATAQELDALPGIGPVTAAKILAWRSENGRFTVVDELAEVSGIGPKTLEELRPHVRV